MVWNMTEFNTNRPLRVVGIAGSPTSPSRSTALLRQAMDEAGNLAGHGSQLSTIAVRDLPSQALLGADIDHPTIAEALAQIRAADLVLVATPIYKAAYSGLLKTFLDLLPQDGLRGKTVLALGTGDSIGHLLALDYALKAVLGALGSSHLLDAVYAEDSQFSRDEHAGYIVAPGVLVRLRNALRPLRSSGSHPPLATGERALPLPVEVLVRPAWLRSGVSASFAW